MDSEISGSRIFGEIPGYPEGSAFESRKELFQAGVHGRTMAGISGTIKEGADAIVLSGAYEDDEDWGDLLLYTGRGGRDSESGRQIADQHLDGENLALTKSCLDGKPVRVIRRAGYSDHAPSAGLRYDGLYFIEDYWAETGASGFRVLRFLLSKSRLPASMTRLLPPDLRMKVRLQRQVTVTPTVDAIRLMYASTCQVCDSVTQTPAGPYAEGFHVRPLAKPHLGKDSLSNLLCVCPTHHLRLDRGGLVVTDEFEVLDAVTNRELGPLTLAAGHDLDPEAVRYRLMLGGS